MITTTRRRVLVAGGVLVTTTILAACGVTTTPTGNTTSIATPTVAGVGSASTASAANQPPVAITHIHAVARDPKTGGQE